MLQAECLLLYALIFSLQPNNYLEIGTLYGGSALIVAAALENRRSNGRIFCIDPAPQIGPEHWQQLAARTTLIQGFSLAALSRARTMAGAPFDFALVDGDHSYHGCLRDAKALLPLVGNGAYLIFHDCFNTPVAWAIDGFVRKHASQLLDFGPLTREITIEHVPGEESVA